MDFEGVMLGEISDGERQIPYDFTHTWKLKKKKINNKLIQRTACCLSEERAWEVVKWIKGSSGW